MSFAIQTTNRFSVLQPAAKSAPPKEPKKVETAAPVAPKQENKVQQQQERGPSNYSTFSNTIFLFYFILKII